MRMIDASVVLAVRDLRVSTKFYADVLGMRLDFSDGASWSFLSRDGFKVMLGECPEVTPATDIGDHSYIAYVRVDNVDEIHAGIVERGGGELISAPRNEPWGMREAGLRTPDGHRITFGQRIE